MGAKGPVSTDKRSGPWGGTLGEYRQLILRQFESDLEFYQLFLLLVNKSCPIKRVDVVWADDGPAVRVGLRQKTMCTEAALASRCVDLVGTADSEPHFCNLVNDWGRHQEQSCAISDGPAEKRVRETRQTSIYQCHAGLVDIAVPVVCEGQHIATLFAGQVLTQPKTQDQFVQIRHSLERLDYLDFQKLEEAYWQVPVVSQDDIRHTVSVLEIFAAHLSKTWKRLIETVRDQQQRDRELRLLRKEFAHILLDGNPPVDESLPELMARIGLRRYPNRAMLISPESAESYGAFGLSFQLAFSSMLGAIDQVCGALPDICFAYLHQCGFCVFFCDREDAGDLYTTAARSLAEKILAAVSAACGLRARVGIGSVKHDWKGLADSYQEACVALTETGERIAVYHELRESTAELSRELAELTRCITDRKIADARRAVRTLPLAVQRRPKGANALDAQRHLFAFALAKMASMSANFGDDPPDAMELVRGLASAPSAAALQQTFLAAAERILSWIESVYSGQHEKLVRLACRQIERALEHSETARMINVHQIAASVGVSPAYLTRLFKRAQGMTFERYLMQARVMAAQKLFLDPMLPVCAVADRCGFADVAYFARVFRQIVGCSPTVYRQNPRRFLSREYSQDGSAAAGASGAAPPSVA